MVLLIDFWRRARCDPRHTHSRAMLTGYQGSVARRSLRGPSYFVKAVMRKLMRDSSWVKRERKARRPINFRLDPTRRYR